MNLQLTKMIHFQIRFLMFSHVSNVKVRKVESGRRNLVLKKRKSLCVCWGVFFVRCSSLKTEEESAD